MRKIKYYIVDVFAENRFEGNQLAVFEGGSNLTDEEMLTIAKEINYPEVSFLLSESFSLRIFTPEGEVPFAGHPTLGTAFIIQEFILKEKISKICLNLQAGEIPITFDYDSNVLWMEQLSPVFSRILPSQSILNALNITEDDLDLRFPIQELSTGLPTLLVPMKNSDAVKKCKIHLPDYFKLVEGIDAKLIHVFCPYDGNGNHLRVRNFGDYYGVSEEPATGSANGCLAAYLVKYDYFKQENIDIKVEQGREIGRLGHLYLQAKKNKGEIKVTVGGKVSLVAEGVFYI